MLELQKFCSTDKSRPELHKPFSCGNFTYATNGHICVRVTKRDGALEDNGRGEWIAKFFKKQPEMSPAKFAPLQLIATLAEVKCPECNGRGREHDCPACECECDNCAGTGKAEKRRSHTYVNLRGAAFDLKYVRQIAALPAVELELFAPKLAPMYFRFDGGDGVLMPVRADGAIKAEIP